MIVFVFFIKKINFFHFFKKISRYSIGCYFSLWNNWRRWFKSSFEISSNKTSNGLYFFKFISRLTLLLFYFSKIRLISLQLTRPPKDIVNSLNKYEFHFLFIYFAKCCNFFFFYNRAGKNAPTHLTSLDPINLLKSIESATNNEISVSGIQ